MEPVIRTAGPEALHHAQTIHDSYYVASGMYGAVFSKYVAASIEAFRNNWDGDKDCIWLAEMDDKLVGYVAVCHTGEADMQLRYLFVDEAARGHGLGRTLVGLVVNHARAVGANGIRLWTMEGLEPARKLYESFGWKLTETESAPWHGSLLQQRFDLEL